MLGQSFLPKIGGEELGLDLRARQYVNEGHDVVVLVQHSSLLGTPGKLDVPYKLVRYRKARSRHWAVPFLHRALLRLYREWPFDVIDCHKLYPTAVAALQAAKTCRSCLVITLHDTWSVAPTAARVGLFSSLRTRLNEGARRRACQALEEADAVTAMNESMRKYLIGLCPRCVNHLHVIPNIVDVQRLAQPAGASGQMAQRYSCVKGRYLLFLGRLARIKRVDVLIEAFRIVARTNPDVLLIIAGDGSEMSNLQQQVRAADLTNHIRFVGTVLDDEKTWLLQNALCLVLPSRFETFGVVVVESFACGTPVLASRVGGIAELVQPGKNGMLVDVGDANALARSLCDLLNDVDGLRRMRSQARETANGYSCASVAGEFLALFEELLRRRRAG